MISDAWLAGFFDGEGCITGHFYFQKGKYNIHPRVAIQVCLAQKDRSVLDKIVGQYGGKVHVKKAKGLSYHIRWVGKKSMEHVLKIMYPHSICKKEQIALALEFIETIREENLGNMSLPSDIHAARKDIYNKLRLLKDDRANKAPVCDYEPGKRECNSHGQQCP